MLVSPGLKLIENKLIDIEGSCQLDANRRLNYDKIPSHLTECPGLKSGHLVIFQSQPQNSFIMISVWHRTGHKVLSHGVRAGQLFLFKFYLMNWQIGWGKAVTLSQESPQNHQHRATERREGLGWRMTHFKWLAAIWGVLRERKPHSNIRRKPDPRFSDDNNECN